MKPYSQDLRERVIAAIQAGQHSQAKIAETYGVAQTTVENWWRRWRETGRVAALPHVSGNPRVLQDCGDVIGEAVKQQPDITLDELRLRVKAVKGVAASSSMLCRELKRLKLPRKKSRSTIVSARRRA